ncbi:hypothetical protein [Thorsellia kenyensis]|uniref:Uncharacterized protein n=1 Tax=Thorsellia kenyensis TaxID=1549888 RepID=A0ABV6C6H6_9GAMM
MKNFIKLGNKIININEIKKAQIENYMDSDGLYKRGLVIYFRASKELTGTLHKGITEIEELEKMIRDAQ